jgi:NADH-quinone oxidoreductase subunit K
MTPSPSTVVLVTAVVVFAIGTAGVAVRRSPLALFMSIELMLNAAILALVAGSRLHDAVQGQSAALLVFVLGAAEAVVGLSLALALFRSRDGADVDSLRDVKG